MKKGIDPKIQDAAASYAEQFSDGTTLGHFVVFSLEGAGVIARLKPLTAAQWRAAQIR